MRLVATVVLASLAACSDQDRQASEAAARDTAEIRWLVATTQTHPSLQDSSAAGKPLALAPTVRPRPPGVTMAMHVHHPEPEPAAKPAGPHRH